MLGFEISGSRRQARRLRLPPRLGQSAPRLVRSRRSKVVGLWASQAAGEISYLIDELGFDASIDHRSPNMKEELKAACPNGIDIYFENVGGTVWDAVLPLLNNFARVPVCGRSLTTTPRRFRKVRTALQR